MASIPGVRARENRDINKMLKISSSELNVLHFAHFHRDIGAGALKTVSSFELYTFYFC